MLLTTIDLPTPILLHALGLTTMGLYFVFSNSPSSSSNTTRSPQHTLPREAEVRYMLGIATMGLGLGYLTTSYMPVSQNQFLHATVPVRIALGALAGLKVVVSGNRLSRDARKEFLILALYDGLGGIAVGYWLGRWDGRVEGY